MVFWWSTWFLQPNWTHLFPSLSSHTVQKCRTLYFATRKWDWKLFIQVLSPQTQEKNDTLQLLKPELRKQSNVFVALAKQPKTTAAATSLTTFSKMNRLLLLWTSVSIPDCNLASLSGVYKRSFSVSDDGGCSKNARWQGFLYAANFCEDVYWEIYSHQKKQRRCSGG